MTDSLGGARLKLTRAHEHLEVLSNELDAFQTGKPYRVAHEPNADDSEHIFRAQILKQPPQHLSVIIGDALQNMRSVLEHLAWGLSPQSTRNTAERSIGFPICRTEQTFYQTNRKSTSGYDPRSGGMHKIWTMDSKVRTAIHQLQPYYTGRDDLLILNELARIDRHQSLRLMGGHNPSVTQGWRKKGTRGPFVADFSRCSGVGGTVSEVKMGAFEHDAVIGHFRFNEPEMEVNFQTDIYVAFRDEGPAKGRHALRTLVGIRRHIESVVVPKLERFF